MKETRIYQEEIKNLKTWEENDWQDDGMVHIQVLPPDFIHSMDWQHSRCV